MTQAVHADGGSIFVQLFHLDEVRLHGHAIRLSMDGKGCWRDNAFIGRVWRWIKCVEVYLHADATVSIARGCRRASRPSIGMR
ncbi:hypothetical protein FZ025_08110 [Xanthomonas hyacinthi]|uniref:Uncharacterized protein n=1 Tax=Xanthomonas hyacinthi TaxID=56455 RepID=A0A2S7EXL6_9XANT|nr:hypothetical protein XhyaCFBP1156_08660 [Xanthomonas hyacinthi]QGY76626.1 hypothetical protein FZ025_08110 [Xanthomonas hyacinthi]